METMGTYEQERETKSGSESMEIGREEKMKLETGR